MSVLSEKAVVGCLLGSAVGDALGLCAENLSPRRQRRLFPDMSRYHFLFGRGMTSDDTEHACMTGQALLASGGDVRRFARSLAWRLRWWLLGLPAGAGRATLLASMKLWLGFPPHRSGIFSAGNGPAMRAPLLGVCHGQEPARLRELVRASTLLTHKDPKAECAALAVAWAAYRSSTAPAAEWTPAEYQKELEGLLGAEAREFLDLVGRAVASAATGQTSAEFAEGLGLKRGVTGYVYHTVPVVLQAWFRHAEDLRGGLLEVIGCGGDTDTTAAILGGIIGARVSKEGIPAEWLSGLWEWPRSVAWMERLGRRLVEPTEGPKRPLRLSLLGLLLRNVLFFVVVLWHVFRRWLPPY
jgi:ADP-ribosylglycohydrolase